jgi:hypothetical protein
LPDSALINRVREIVRGHATTEAELRKLRDQTDTWTRLLEGRLQASERKLEAVADHPDTPLAEAVAELQRSSVLRPQLDELHSLTFQLDRRSRELRSHWLEGK